MARTAFGAKRSPVRNGAPESEGSPMIAASMPSRRVACGSRMKVGTPTKRGVASESTGRSLMGSEVAGIAALHPPRCLGEDRGQDEIDDGGGDVELERP